jgi:hypothetical protein
MIQEIKNYFKSNTNSLGIKTTNIINLIKFYLPWDRSNKIGQTAIKDRKPWITFEAREYLKKIIHKDMRVFEYGSGGSTLYFLDNVAEVVTVEHDTSWFNLVKNSVKDNRKLTYLLITPTLLDIPISKPNYSNPEMYLSADDNFLNKYSFIDYAKSISKYPDEYFDIISVDGRARPSCIKESLSKVKKNGYIMLDNSDRKYYTECLEEDLKEFQKVFEVFGPGPYNLEFWVTTFYKKI